MKILLDTHIFLWYISGDHRIPQIIVQNVQNPQNGVFLSLASLWEITIKYQLGKLVLPQSPETYIPIQRQKHLINSLDIDEASVCQLIKLPLLHNDPFDRLLICQSIEHSMTIATVDNHILVYPVSTL